MNFLSTNEIDVSARVKYTDGKDDYGYIIENTILSPENIIYISDFIKFILKLKYNIIIPNQDVALIKDALEDTLEWHLHHETRKKFAKKHGMMRRILYGEFLVNPFKGVKIKKERTLEKLKNDVNKETIINILRHIIETYRLKNKYFEELNRGLINRLDMSRNRPEIIFRRRRAPKMEYTRKYTPNYYGKEVHPFKNLFP
jgi:hypothetical protein